MEKFENKQEIIDLFKAADVSQDDWAYPILAQVKDEYFRGYVQHQYEVFSENLLRELLRAEMLDFLERIE